MTRSKLKLFLLILSLVVLTAFSYQGIQRFATVYVQTLRVTNSGEFNGTSDFNGASTFDGASTFNGAVTLGTVTAPVVGYATTGKRLFCATNTITDTATYTVSASAIATPVSAWCSMNAITGDAEKCAALQATGAVTVTVRNAAATPVANGTGAAVTWCVLGTP